MLDIYKNLIERDLEVKEKNDKINELTDICFRYSEEAYRFIGQLDRDKLTVEERIALNRFKDAVDSCIQNNEDYMSYLEHKYIIKDIGSINEYVEKMAENQNEVFMQTSLDDMYEEDDTETLVITEKEKEELTDEQKELFYNILTKSFIDNSDDKSIYDKVVEETFKEEK